jgi:hypothetical protein|tara:strand:+ start:1055 stop:1381 length:327 start_codon:yes stop_codon:yes gene_type:complete
MKRTLKRELNVSEIVEKEASGRISLRLDCAVVLRTVSDAHCVTLLVPEARRRVYPIEASELCDWSSMISKMSSRTLLRQGTCSNGGGCRTGRSASDTFCGNVKALKLV